MPKQPGEDPADHVRHLAGEMHGEVEIRAGRVDGDRAPLHGHDGHSLVLEATPHHNIGASEWVVAAGAQPDEDVTADRLELERRIRVQRILHVDHGAEWLVVDLDQFGGVHRLGP